MGNDISADHFNTYTQNHGGTSEATKEATTKAVLQRLKDGGVVNPEIIKDYVEIYEKASLAVEKNFPGAGTSRDILGQVANVLKRIGCTNENTLFAQSICPDEINHEDDDITRLFQLHLGEVFHMGGLAGIPFTGKTGFLAFSHHIPDDGNLFILFAPHVGISNTGKVGEFSRIGQNRDGKACGAAAAGLSHCCSPNAVIPTLADLGNNPYDYQQMMIIREIHSRLECIKEKSSDPNSNEMQAELAFQMYDIVKCFLNRIVTTDFHKDDGDSVHGRLIILGGIQINMPYPMEDYFLPLMFESRVLDKPTICMVGETFATVGASTRGVSDDTTIPTTTMTESADTSDKTITVAG